jgi:AcrR family transcriptional regulator
MNRVRRVPAVAARGKRLAGRGERRRQETRAKLIRAAHELMAEKGIGATTIQEITDTADVGFGSFYNHFESKQAIVQAIIGETIESYGDALDHIADAVEDPAEVVAASVRYVVMRGSEDPTWGWFLLRSVLLAQALRTGFGRRLMRDISLGIEAGRFRVGDVTYATLAISGVALSVLAARLHGELGADAPENAAAISLKLLGLSARQAEAVANRPLPEIPVESRNAAA